MDPFLAFLPEGSHLSVRKSQAIPVSFRKDVLGKAHDDQDFQKLLMVVFSLFLFFFFLFFWCRGRCSAVSSAGDSLHAS